MPNEQEAVREVSRDTQTQANPLQEEFTQQIEPRVGGGHSPGGGGGGFPHPAPMPRPEPPRPMPRPEPPRPAPVPRPEPPRPQPPRPEPPRPEPPRPQPPRPEPPRPEPPRPQPPRPEPPRPEPPRPHPPHPEPPRPEPPRPHPPHPEPPRPEPPRPHPPHPHPHPPHPPDPDHGGWKPGHEYHPPRGEHWGWHDYDRWERGWDPWFWRQDPNWDQWRDPIKDAAFNIAQKLDYGDAQGAANELATDLYAMRGDRYAQDELLNEINADEVKGIGADLYLGNWDPSRGTWDDIEVVPNDGSVPIHIDAYDYGDPPPWELTQPEPVPDAPGEDVPVEQIPENDQQ